MTSKNTKQKRQEQARLKRARTMTNINTLDPDIPVPAGAVMADHNQLQHNNTYSPYPQFYIDQIVTCRDCGMEEVWPAENQKWWYEEIKANLNAQAVHCRACRKQKKVIKNTARNVHQEGRAEKKKN